MIKNKKLNILYSLVTINIDHLKEIISIINQLDKELGKLEQYRELFKKIENSDQDLEYLGDELTMYYKEIESNDK